MTEQREGLGVNTGTEKQGLVIEPHELLTLLRVCLQPSGPP